MAAEDERTYKGTRGVVGPQSKDCSTCYAKDGSDEVVTNLGGGAAVGAGQ